MGLDMYLYAARDLAEDERKAVSEALPPLAATEQWSFTYRASW